MDAQGVAQGLHEVLADLLWLLSPFPAGWELCLGSAMDNHNISAQHRNTDWRNQQKEVLMLAVLFLSDGQELHIPFAQREQHTRRSWESLIWGCFSSSESAVWKAQKVFAPPSVRGAAAPAEGLVTGDAQVWHCCCTPSKPGLTGTWVGRGTPKMLSWRRGKEQNPWKMQLNTAANSWGKRLGINLQCCSSNAALAQPLLKSTLNWLLNFQSHCGCFQKCTFWSCCAETEWK